MFALRIIVSACALSEFTTGGWQENDFLSSFEEFREEMNGTAIALSGL